MKQIEKEVFVCLDCESTGLDEKQDKVIEVAAVRFTLHEILDTFESLVDPEQPIPELSQSIHHISTEMVQGKPKILEILPPLFQFIGKDPIVGHKIDFDIDILNNEAKRASFPGRLDLKRSIDTLRLARLYGECPSNSLERLRQHFNIPAEGIHRALSDVKINVEVFKFLVKGFDSTKAIFNRLADPVKLKTMPLGKHKGRSFNEIPLEYLHWAAHQAFDQDLLFSIRQEINQRKKKKGFEQASNPFSCLE